MGADAILDGLTTAVVCLDAELRIVTLNPASESLFGVSLRLAHKQPLAVALPHLAAHEVRLREALDAGSGFIERELELRRHGERPVIADCTATPVPLGKRVGLLLELVPLDRHLRTSRDELLTSQYDTSRELVRGLAHEIKNPLGGIRGAAQLLEREFPDPQLQEYTGVIIREADRLQNLVDRMLGPNRPTQRAPLNIHEVLEDVRRLVEAEASADISIDRDYDPSIPELMGDREQLTQAVLNVARNALQAVASGGHIRLRSRTRRQVAMNGFVHRLAVVVEIEDDGPGIAPDMSEKIFYPLVTTRPGGSGLGLPISQVLIHGHGGSIECQSQPGRTVFSIILPLEQTA